MCLSCLNCRLPKIKLLYPGDTKLRSVVCREGTSEGKAHRQHQTRSSSVFNLGVSRTGGSSFRTRPPDRSCRCRDLCGDSGLRPPDGRNIATTPTVRIQDGRGRRCAFRSPRRWKRLRARRCPRRRCAHCIRPYRARGQANGPIAHALDHAAPSLRSRSSRERVRFEVRPFAAHVRRAYRRTMPLPRMGHRVRDGSGIIAPSPLHDKAFES